MSEERVALEFLGKQLERVIAEQNSTRDDLRVLTTIVLRLAGTLNGFATNCMQWSRSTNASTPAYVGSRRGERLKSTSI
jgi:hypothetical protein